VLMLLCAWTGLWLGHRAHWHVETLPRRFLQVLAAMTFAGSLATLCGWYVTEIGRQPFMVFGLLRTADLVSKTAAPLVATTLALYLTLYVALVVAYVAVLKYMAEKREEVLADQEQERKGTPPGIATSPSAAAGRAT